MADKILVNYEGNVQPLVDALKRVEAEQAKVDASAKKTSDDIGKGATDAAKKVDTLGNEIKKTGTEAEETGKKAKKAFDETGNTAGVLNKTISRLGVAIAGAFAVDKLIAFGKESVKLAREQEGVLRAFNALNNPALLTNLRAATKGTVSDLELMKQAVNAKNLGVPIQQLGTFFEFARRRAAQTGESVEFLTQSIVLGLGRKSPLILDNLGLSAAKIGEEFKKTGDFGVAAANIIQTELAGMGEDLTTSADKAAQLDVKIANLSATFGKALLPAMDKVVDMLQVIAEGFRSTSDVIDDVNEKIRGQEFDSNRKELEDYIARQRERLGVEFDLNKSIEERIKFLQGQQDAAILRGETDEDYIKSLGVLIADTRKFGAEMVIASKQATVQAGSISELKQELELLTAIRDKAVIGSEKYNEATREMARIQGILNAELKETQKTEQQIIDDRIKALKDKNAETKRDTAEDEMPDVNRVNEEIKALDALLKKDKEVTQQELDNIKATKEREDQSFQDNLDRLEREEQAREQAEANKQAAIQATFDLAVSLGNALAQIQNNALERDAMAIQARSNAELEAIDKELSAKNISERRKEELIKQRDALEEQSAQQLAEIRKKQAINDKAAALFEIAINTAAAITKFLAAGQPVLAAFAAAQGIIQGAVVASQPIPEFAKGVVDLQGPGTGTSDSINAKLSKGESVIQAANTKKYRSAVEAIHGDYFDKYVTQNHVLPALREYDRVMNEKKGKDLASNLAASLNLQNIFKDGNIVYELKRGRWNGEANTDKIVKAIKKSRVKTRPGKS